MKRHFNTTHLDGYELKTANESAAAQQVAIMDFFKARPGSEYTACQVFISLNSYPLTSVRRAISNLASAGQLIKTANRQVGIFGALAYTWKLAQLSSAAPGTQLALA